MEAPSVDGVSTTVVKSTYPRQLIVPGGHHDNENGAITKIKILPTKDEIRSDYPEFLPSTDLDQPYFLNDPVARHLDTHFRLLRHDIFGELKEALGGLINNSIDDPTLFDKSRLSLGDMRAYPYTKAHIAYVSFKRSRGVEAHHSFNQIQPLRKKSSTRLEEGSLLCFVSFINNKSSLLFLTVSEMYRSQGILQSEFSRSYVNHCHQACYPQSVGLGNSYSTELSGYTGGFD